jgi:acetoin utilization protein AcuB
MSIAKQMTTSLIYVRPDASLSEMHTVFESRSIHHLLVMESGKLLGIVSDRDVLRLMSPFSNTQLEGEKDRFASQLPASRIMKSNIVSVGVHEGLRKAASLMLENGISLLPVIETDDQVVGVLSWKDILRFIAD